jgi:hypothetical protein
MQDIRWQQRRCALSEIPLSDNENLDEVGFIAKLGTIRVNRVDWLCPRIDAQRTNPYTAKNMPAAMGWPNRFLDRMDRVGTRVVVVQSDGVFSSGFDNADALAALPEHYSGTIWTDRIDVIAPLVNTST